MEYTDFIDRLRLAEPVLTDELAGFRGVEHVLQWMQQCGLCRTAVDLVGMDEFNYDFLIQLEPNGRWLAFGVT